MQASTSKLPGWASAALGSAALALALASLWPGGGVPAWPAASVACLALALAWLPCGVVCRALGTISGVLALGMSSAEIAVLWLVAEVLRT